MPFSETGSSSSEPPPDSGPGSPLRADCPAREELWQWLESLTATGRLMIVLHYREGLTPDEIGRILNLQERTVASQLRAFRVRARAILRKHGVSDGARERDRPGGQSGSPPLAE